jgi:azurin
MKFLNILFALSLTLFIACGGSGDNNEQTNQQDRTTDDVRTINVIGIDQMQFVVEENADGITLGEAFGADSLRKLVGITAEPGEEIRIRLTTRSQMNANAMAHNWLLLTMDTDAQAFSTAALRAKDNDYVPANMTDQILAQTGLVGGGETTEVTFTAPEEPGEYEYICTFPGHFSAGMKGVLTVQES